MFINSPSSESLLLYVLLLYAIVYTFIIILFRETSRKTIKMYYVKPNNFEESAVGDSLFSSSSFTSVSSNDYIVLKSTRSII